LAIFQEANEAAKATQTPPQFDDSVKECSTLMVMITSILARMKFHPIHHEK
jgi:hypothetical protein